MRVLYIGTGDGTACWLTEALAADSASKIQLEESRGTADGLARLREEVFDAILVGHAPAELDALDLVEGYRAGGAEEPIIILGEQDEQAMAALCHEVGADGYVGLHTTTRNLLWVVARAVERRQLIRENRRLSLTEQSRRQREQDEAADVLGQQRALVSDSGGAGERGLPPLADELMPHYRQLLRTYVIMGSGNLTAELRPLAELLVMAGITARQTMQIHLHVLEELVHGLGTRSARHVTTRADLLVLELLMHLADGYGRRYHERACPPIQRQLPGFDEKLGMA
jgi:DNA-binding NarL/FixJ family response regulator